MGVTASFSPSSDGTNVKFMGVDLESKPRAFVLRVKTKEDAARIVEAIKAEVEAMK